MDGPSRVGILFGSFSLLVLAVCFYSLLGGAGAGLMAADGRSAWVRRCIGRKGGGIYRLHDGGAQLTSLLVTSQLQWSAGGSMQRFWETAVVPNQGVVPQGCRPQDRRDLLAVRLLVQGH